MLKNIRKNLSHTATKIILAFLVLTFVLWGIGDALKGSKDNIAFQVGDIEYTKTEWYNFYRTQFDRMGDDYQQFYGVNSKALQGLFLKQLINSLLLKQEAKRLGIIIGDDAVKYEIINNMPMLARDGKFDKDLLIDFLQKSNISERFFIERIREELAQGILMDTISSGNLMNNTLLKQLTEALYTTRELKIYKADHYAFNIDKNPTDDELQAALEANQEMFTVPEKRSITFIRLALQDVAVNGERSSNDEIEKFYSENSHLFALPEKRKFLKVIFKNESDAKAQYNELKAGKDFIELAKSLKQDFGANSNPVTKEGFNDNIGHALFSLKKNEISEPIITPMGWCIFKVLEIVPEFAQPLNTVKKEIEEYLKQQRLDDRYQNKMQEIESALNSGSPLEAIAKSHNLELHSDVVSLDPQIKYDDRTILKNKIFIDTLSSLESGATSGLEQSIPAEECFAVRVDNIELSYVMLFEQIKEKLTSLWREDMQKKQALNALYEARKNPDHNAPGIKITTQNLSISSNNMFNNDELIEIFTSPLNQPTKIFSVDGERFFIKTTSIKLPSQQLLKEVSQNEADKLNNLKDILINDYLNSLKKVHKIKIHDISIPEI